MIKVHTPVPVEGILPFNVAEEEQMVWSAPAAAMVGLASTLMVTSSNEGGHVPLLIVQRKTFAPTDKPLIVEVGDAGETMVPVPEMRVHVPVPTEGVFPANEVEEEQRI